MRRAKKIAAALGAVALVVSLYNPAGAVERGGGLDNFERATPCPVFEDVADDWTHDGIEAACELALMKGTSGTTFSPDAPVTVQEAVTIAARMNAIYKTGSDAICADGEPCGNEAAWASPYIKYALDGGLIYAGDFSDFTADATRAQVAYIFAYALPIDSGAYEARNVVDDEMIPDVRTTDPYGGHIYALYRAGIVTGGDGHSFGPDRSITRAETAAIVSRLPFPTQHQRVTLLNPDVAHYAKLADGVTQAPWQSRTVYVGTANNSTGQPRKTAASGAAVNRIDTRYGFHNYWCSSQKEYDAVISAIQNSYNASVKKGTSALDGVIMPLSSWQVVDNIIASRSYDANEWKTWLSRKFPAIANNVSGDKAQAQTLRLYGQYLALYTGISMASGETGGITAYDTLYLGKNSCNSETQVQMACADMLGIDSCSYVSKEHQASILRINGVYFSGETQWAYSSYEDAISWADAGSMTEWTSATSPLK